MGVRRIYMNLDHIDEGLLVSVQLHESPMNRLTPLTKLFVDGEQLGLISSIELKASSGDFLPAVRIGILEDISEAAYKGVSQGIKDSVKSTVQKLRRFPNVTVVCPEYLT
jgi:hypothetical protein